MSKVILQNVKVLAHASSFLNGKSSHDREVELTVPIKVRCEGIYVLANPGINPVARIKASVAVTR